MTGTCGTCEYGRPGDGKLVACHWQPPVVTVVQEKVRTLWPMVRAEDGCGQWRRAPTRLQEVGR
jgi:hypothetical protein